MLSLKMGSIALRSISRTIALVALSTPYWALSQVPLYEFRTNMGTYQPITGGTVLVSGTTWNNEVFSVMLPSAFFFDGSWYPNMYVSSNGFITFGSAPSGTNYTPLSSTETYAGAIAPFGCNLHDANLASSSVRWEHIGNEVVVQWQDVRRTVPTNDVFDFQVRMDLQNGMIRFVYGQVTALGLAESGFPQVGLRGPDNAFPTNVNNLLVNDTYTWYKPGKGTAANNRCRFTSKAPQRKPAEGRTYTWAWSAGMELELETDGNGGETSWEILPHGGGPAVCAGSGYGNNTTYILPCLVQAGSYRLRVTDVGGNGMGTGGYVLKNLRGDVIIDNRDDGTFTNTSEVALPFQLPLGKVHMTDSTCSIEDKFTEHWVRVKPDPDVRLEYGIGNQADDGYQWWFYDPDGGYSRRLFYSHATNNYQFPAGGDRCSYLRLGHVVTSPLPLNVLLNMKVRSCVNGVFRPWGKACRVRIDLPDLCPALKLVDDTNHPRHSCGITNVYLNGSRWLHSEMIPTAHMYKFRFTAPGYTRNVTSTHASVLMDVWFTNPLQYGVEYEVCVASSYDNGATWCPFGPACTVTTASGPPAIPGEQRAFDPIAARDTELMVYPTVINEGPLNIALNGLDEEIDAAQLMFVSMNGEVVHRTSMPVSDGVLQVCMELPSTLASGPYVVLVEAGQARYTRRVIVE